MSDIFEMLVQNLFAFTSGEYSLQTNLGIVAITVALVVLIGAFILAAQPAVSALLLWSVTIALEFLLIGAACYLFSGSEA